MMDKPGLYAGRGNKKRAYWPAIRVRQNKRNDLQLLVTDLLPVD